MRITETNLMVTIYHTILYKEKVE